MEACLGTTRPERQLMRREPRVIAQAIEQRPLHRGEIKHVELHQGRSEVIRVNRNLKLKESLSGEGHRAWEAGEYVQEYGSSNYEAKLGFLILSIIEP